MSEKGRWKHSIWDFSY